MKFEYDKIWYDGLKKPSFQPPKELFQPVWTILYLLMFVSLFMVVFSKGNSLKIFAYLFFALQMGLNLLWTPVFFKLHNLKGAFYLCVTLLIAVIFTAVIFYQISSISGLLFLPYVIWTSFASFLSFTIWKLNS